MNIVPSLKKKAFSRTYNPKRSYFINLLAVVICWVDTAAETSFAPKTLI